MVYCALVHLQITVMSVSVAESYTLSLFDTSSQFLATAVIMSITGSQPFNGAADQNLSVAYIAAFVLVFFVSIIFLSYTSIRLTSMIRLDYFLLVVLD